jgi:hypothetical protein
MTPLQFFGQLTVKADHSQFLHFFPPLFGFLEKPIDLGIHSIHPTKEYLSKLSL